METNTDPNAWAEQFCNIHPEFTSKKDVLAEWFKMSMDAMYNKTRIVFQEPTLSGTKWNPQKK